MATSNQSVKTDGTPMTPMEVTLNVPGTSRSRRSSEIESENANASDTLHPKRVYTERKWNNLDPFEYEYDKTDPGYVMIINQRKFKFAREREGTEFDAEEIVKCFGRQGYNINRKNIINDSTKEQLLTEVNRVCVEELNDTNSLIVFVLSHGERDNKLHVHDDTVTMQELVEPFLKVDALVNKPKIFIFQACKTNSVQRTEMLEQSEKRQSQNLDPDDVKLYVNSVLTAEPDVLMYCSTLEGDYSYRDTQRGSWLIQELCRNIYTHGHREEILSILIRCNKCLARNYYFDITSPQDISMNEKQTPLFVSTLTKNFYICRSKDRYFYIEKMSELRKALKQTEDLLATMTMRRKTLL